MASATSPAPGMIPTSQWSVQPDNSGRSMALTDDERPAKTQTAERKSLVEVMRTLLYRLEDLRIALRQSWRDLTLHRCTHISMHAAYKRV